jgi:hypothetical protein
LNPKYSENALRQRLFLPNRLKLVLKPFKQPVGFQEKHAVAMLHRSQMRLSCNDLRHTFQDIHLLTSKLNTRYVRVHKTCFLV